MTRTVDERHRAELLERIVDYVMANGLAALSLRPLAKAVRSSPRVLLYYFGSKDELIVSVLALARARQRVLFDRLKLQSSMSSREICLLIWSAMSAPKSEPVFRLFFEVYSLALQDRRRFAGFLSSAVGDWLAYLEAPRLRAGYSRADARALATIVLAGFRGFLLDLCATRDRKRIDRAVLVWLDTLDSIPTPKELSKAHDAG